ncbi:MAG: DUF3391 domain-containing protein, partial [Zoogloea sp.]|nr:DUF3391 domain-containing protein [Zoogloea sp.]
MRGCPLFSTVLRLREDALKEIVAAQDLRIGMFVCELDRPWLESPFMLQGFLIEDQPLLD